MIAFSPRVMMSDHAWCPERSRDVLRDAQEIRRVTKASFLMPLYLSLDSEFFVKVVRVSAVVRSVQTSFFLFDGNAKETGNLKRAEQERTGESDPSDDCEDADDLVAELFTAAAVESAVVVSTAHATVVVEDIFLLGEETGGNDAPSAAETVDGRGIERVVDFQLLEKRARAVIDASTDQTDECGGPRFDHDTIAGNRNETGEDPITHRTDVQRLCQEVVDGKRRDAASRGA